MRTRLAMRVSGRRLPTDKAGLVAVLLVAALAAPSGSLRAQGTNAGAATPQPPGASAAGLGGMFRGLRDRLSRKASGNSPSASSAALPDTDTDIAPAAGGASAADVIKIKTFKPVAGVAAGGRRGSRLGAQWNDTHCPNLVEPFGLTDNVMSLGVMKGRSVAEQAMASILGTKPAEPKVDRAEIREAARRLNWLPMSVEMQIGQRIHDGQTDLLREDRASSKAAYARARRILASVTASVQEPTPYVFKIYVTNRREGNAEAAPGGWIYVDQDLVGSPSKEALARFAIAHEVSHVLQRHRTRETQMRLSDGVDSLQALYKLVGSMQANGGGQILQTTVDTKRMFVRHSEEQELQADGCAVRLLDTMLDDRAEVVRSIDDFVATLPKPTPPEPQRQVTAEAQFGELSNGELARHPNTRERMDNLKAVVSTLNGGK